MTSSKQIPPSIQKLLQHYNGENPGVLTHLAQLLMHGATGGSGRLIILPVDQGFEHGPARSFEMNPASYDPHYHFSLAIKGGASAYAAPLGMLEAGAANFAGQVPIILKMNSGNSVFPDRNPPDQAVTASVDDALRLGCIGVGLTLYPGSDASYNMIEEAREIVKEARAKGLFVVIWSYPRGPEISKAGETSLDIISYGAHMAALLGAHIIKVKLPTSHIELSATAKAYKTIPHTTLTDRVRHVVRCCFEGRRLVVFSGGEAKTVQDILAETQAIHDGGGHGSIIGRNSFQRSNEEALGLLSAIKDIYIEKKREN